MSRRLFVPTALALSAAALLSACASDGYYPGGGYYPDNGGYSDGRYYPPNDGRYYPNDGRYNPNDGRYYPDGRYPDNRRRPDGRYPDGRYPGGRTPEQATEDYNRAASAQREDMVRRVQAAFRADRRLGTSIVVESPSTGVIRLSGAPAGGQPAFGLAIDTARRVPGVREVENRLATY